VRHALGRNILKMVTASLAWGLYLDPSFRLGRQLERRPCDVGSMEWGAIEWSARLFPTNEHAAFDAWEDPGDFTLNFKGRISYLERSAVDIQARCRF